MLDGRRGVIVPDGGHDKDNGGDYENDSGD